MVKKSKGNQSESGLDCKPIGELMSDEDFRNKLGTEIFNATVNGNASHLRNLIISEKNGSNFENIKQYLPLLAAGKNQVDILRNFLSISSASSIDTQNRTPLHYAAYNCHVGVVRFLLTETRLDHTVADKVGYTAFQYACVGGDTDVMDLILDKEEDDVEISNDREDISNPNFGVMPVFSAPTLPDGSMMMAPQMAPPAARQMCRAPVMNSVAPPSDQGGPMMMAPMMRPQAMAPSMPMMRPMAPEMGFAAPMAPPTMGFVAAPEMDFPAPMAPPAMGFLAPSMESESSMVNGPMENLESDFAATPASRAPMRKMTKKPAMESNGDGSRELVIKKSNVKKQDNMPKKFFLQSLILAARRGNTKAVFRLLDQEAVGKEAGGSGFGSGRNSLLHLLGRRISAQELGKLADCGLDITSRNTSGVRAFEEVPPPVLQEFLDMNVTAASENIDENVTESYVIKNPFLNQDHPNLDMTTLLEISNSTIHTKLIFHPVFFGICSIKWKYIRKLYWFVVFLSFLLAVATSWITVTKVRSSYDNKLSSNVTAIKNEEKGLIEDNDLNIFICQVVTCCLLIVLVITEISNMLFHNLTIYIIRYMVIILCSVSVVMLIFVFPIGILQENAFFVIFIPWLVVMYHICQHYSYAQYYSNFVQIAKTSLKIMFVFGSIPIAFSIVFHIMMMKEKSLGGDEISAFDYFYASNVKTIAMMIGDLSMDDFSSQFTNLQWSVTYLLFIVGVALVLYNMINALAVSDTQKLNERAEVFRMVALTRQILALQNWIRFFTRFPCFQFLNVPMIKDFTVNCKNYRWNVEKYTYETKSGADVEVPQDIEIRAEDNSDVKPKYSLRSRCKHISVRCNAKFVEDLKNIVESKNKLK